MLSKRQREVLGLRAKGLRRKEIAARLKLSEDTIRNHIVGAYRKLDVDNLTDALRTLGLL